MRGASTAGTSPAPAGTLGPIWLAGLLWLAITAASCGSYELWPKTEEFLGRLECGKSEEEVAAIAADYPGLDFKDSQRGTPWDKVAYKPQTSIVFDFEEGGLRRAEVSWVDAILHSKQLPVREFCSLEGQSGRDPRRTKVGRRTSISGEAAAEWRRRMEAETAQGDGVGL